jgi:1-acyl-sn-glycerol-3-phosphate acyltransferase
MNVTWQPEEVPKAEPVGLAGWVRAVLRGTTLGLVTFGCLALLLLARLVERPIFGVRRPATPYITQFVCRSAFVILGIRRAVHGSPMRRGGAVVANHGSWLDIFTLNAGQRVYFVSKSDVRSWPGIGWLARATGTVFIERKAREARVHRDLISERIAMGHKLLFFPEGTSTDGRRVLPFRSTLFDAFFQAGDKELTIQPVTVVYTAPEGRDARFYAWWGDMDFGAHLLKVLAAPRQGCVDVTYHPPLKVGEHANRKLLARRAYELIAGEHDRRLRP